MGLYDRDWFWENADRRYGYSSSKKIKQQAKTNNLDSSSKKQVNITQPNICFENTNFEEIFGNILGDLFNHKTKGNKLTLEQKQYLQENYDIKQVYCKHCLKISNIAFPKKKKGHLDLGQQFNCPNCGKTNYINHWKKLLFDIVFVVAIFAILTAVIIAYALL